MMKLLAPLSILSLAACSAEPADPPGDEVEETAAQPETPTATDTGIETDAESVPPASLGLQPLSYTEIAVGNLGGELGCVFTREPTGEVLFIATSVVQGTEPARGLFKTGSETIRVGHEGTGYAALTEGGAFTTEETELVIELLPAEPSEDGPPAPEEDPLQHARIAVEHQGDMAREQGFWDCGP